LVWEILRLAKKAKPHPRRTSDPSIVTHHLRNLQNNNQRLTYQLNQLDEAAGYSRLLVGRQSESLAIIKNNNRLVIDLLQLSFKYYSGLSQIHSYDNITVIGYVNE